MADVEPPRFFVARDAVFRPCSVEDLLARSTLLGYNAVSNQTDVVLKTSNLAPADLALPKVRLATHGLLRSRAVGYRVVLSETPTEKRVLFFLLVPDAQVVPAVIKTVRAGGMRYTVFHGAGKEYRAIEGPVVDNRVYLSWPNGNPHGKKSWVLHMPGTPDEDTRHCDAELLLDEWITLPRDTAWLPLRLNRTRVPLLAEMAESQPPNTLSDAAITAIWVLMALWAAGSLIVVVVLFVRLKKRAGAK